MRSVTLMNEAHRVHLRTDEWRATLRDLALPFAFGGRTAADLLGADVLEIGPGPGLTTDLLLPDLESLTAIELDPELAGDLRERLGGRMTVVEGDATAMPFENDHFSGVVTFTMLHHVPTVELQDRVFAEACRVLRPGGLFVANDSVGSDELAAFHDGDIYNPVDPATLPDRLAAAGFVDVEVRDNPYAFAVHARSPG